MTAIVLWHDSQTKETSVSLPHVIAAKSLTVRLFCSHTNLSLGPFCRTEKITSLKRLPQNFL